MGSTSLKNWMEILLAAAIAFLLTLIPIVIGEFQITLAILPLIYFGLRRGLAKGLAASLLAGVALLALHQGQSNFTTVFVTHVGPYAFIGITGLFASNTQRTLNNKRFPNAALNIITATTIATILLVIWQLLAQRDTENILISGVLTLVANAIILMLVARFSPKAYIPKDTPFLSRKEKSKLLND